MQVEQVEQVEQIARPTTALLSGGASVRVFDTALLSLPKMSAACALPWIHATVTLPFRAGCPTDTQPIGRASRAATNTTGRKTT
jgi:hypothetical protein